MYGLSERLVEREREARGCHQKSAIPVGVPQLPAGLSSVQPPQTEQHRVKMPLGVLAALTASAGPACPTLGGCGLLNPFWDGTRGFKKKKKRKEKRKKKKTETHNPKHFLDNFKRSCSWWRGTRKPTCEGIVGRSHTLPKSEPTGRTIRAAAEATTLS